MTKKTLNFFLLLLLTTPFISSLFTAEAKILDLETSDSIYISLDLKDPSKIGLELSFISKIGLKGEYNAEDKSLKAKASIQDFDLNRLSEYIKLPVAGYIKKGDLDIDIGKVISLKGELEANELKLTNKNMGLSGDIKLLGYLKILKQGLDYHINYDIKNGYFSKLKDIKEIQAKGFLKKDNLSLTESELIYRNLPLKVTAQIEDFSSPKISLEIASNLCNLRARAQIDEEALAVPEFIITGKDTEITAEMSIGLEKPWIEIQAKGSADFSDLTRVLDIFKLKPPLLAKLNPQGSLDLELTITKTSSQNKEKIKLSSSSEELKIKDLKVKDIKVELIREGNELTISLLKAKVSGGEINLRGVLNPSNNKGNLNLAVNGIDIAQAMNELDLAGKKLRGKLSLEANLISIDLFKWKNLRGEGKILISEGDIYQINFLKGLGKFLSIPDFENIVFKKAYSDLLFENEEIFFENFQLNATQMNIEGKGKITTVGDIDFLLLPQFDQELIDSSKGLQKYLTAFLGGGIFSVSITGTIENPVYTTNISIIPALDKIENIKDIFGDIFDW